MGVPLEIEFSWTWSYNALRPIRDDGCEFQEGKPCGGKVQETASLLERRSLNVCSLSWAERHRLDLTSLQRSWKQSCRGRNQAKRYQRAGVAWDTHIRMDVYCRSRVRPLVQTKTVLFVCSKYLFVGVKGCHQNLSASLILARIGPVFVQLVWSGFFD